MQIAPSLFQQRANETRWLKENTWQKEEATNLPCNLKNLHVSVE